MRYILDCSVAVKWFVPEVDSDKADACLVAEEAGELTFVAPDVLVPELGHTLRRHVIRGNLTRDDADRSLAEFLLLRTELHPSGALSRDALRLALEHSGTFYDALYVALAEREDLKVVTADARMGTAFKPLGRMVSLATLELAQS